MLNLLAEQDDELTRLNSGTALENLKFEKKLETFLEPIKAIDNLSERVDIHCEKVARREVGALTARKPISKAPTIITPGKECFRLLSTRIIVLQVYKGGLIRMILPETLHSDSCSLLT